MWCSSLTVLPVALDCLGQTAIPQYALEATYSWGLWCARSHRLHAIVCFSCIGGPQQARQMHRQLLAGGSCSVLGAGVLKTHRLSRQKWGWW